jgi:hypothetical protein
MTGLDEIHRLEVAPCVGPLAVDRLPYGAGYSCHCVKNTKARWPGYPRPADPEKNQVLSNKQLLTPISIQLEAELINKIRESIANRSV